MDANVQDKCNVFDYIKKIYYYNNNKTKLFLFLRMNKGVINSNKNYKQLKYV